MTLFCNIIISAICVKCTSLSEDELFVENADVILRKSTDKSLIVPRKKQVQRPNSVFIQHTPHEAQYPSKSFALTFASHSKNSEFCPSNQVSAAAMTSPSEKNGDRSIDFSVLGTGGSPTEPDPENRVGDADIGNPGSPVSSGLQVPGETGNVRARTRQPY